MARTLTKQKPVKAVFYDELFSTIGNYGKTKTGNYSSEFWKEQPVDAQTFCIDFLGERLFDLQNEFVEAMTGAGAGEFNTDYDEGHAFWGKGSGKDRTISKMQVFIIYKLLCLKNPQKFLREKYECSIGDDDAIDIANMSINARQAVNVYFKKFKSMVKRCINPKTGKNWFVEQGVDLREGYDLQTIEVKFPNNITAHSLNSETNTGEGLNLFLVTIDEFGSFPALQGFALLDAVRDTVISRFPKIGKVCVISYKYYNNDPMQIVYEKEKNNTRIFSSCHPTWEVNQIQKKENFSKQYQRNPEKAQMTYECKGGDKEGGYVTKKYMLSYMFDPKYENPIKGDPISIDAALLPTIEFKHWFKKTADTGDGNMYAIHVDGGTGKKESKNDCAGFAMVHVENMYPKIDDKLRKDLLTEGIQVEFLRDDPELIVVRKGIVADLAIQLVAKRGTEIQLSDIRKFIIMLKTKYNYNIRFVTYDGWESKDSIQILNNAGIESEVFSVDRNNEAYDTWKELMYQQLFKCYNNNIALREARELVIDDKGKVDHPASSWDRELMEGISTGSKDVMDALVGAGKKAYDNFNLNSGVFFG